MIFNYKMLIYAGVQPYLIDNENRIWVLLGHESGRGYSSFGGKPDSYDYFKEAEREFREETHNLFDSFSLSIDTVPYVKNNLVIIYTSQLPIESLPFIDAYNNTTSYLLNYNNNSRRILQSIEGLFEKTNMKWFILEGIVSNQYENIFPPYLKDTRKLYSFLQKKHRNSY